MKKAIRRLINLLGYTLVKTSNLPPDLSNNMEEEFHTYYEKCKPYTMTMIESMYSLYKAVKFISLNQIPGDVVECGVWKGGSSMLAALTLIGCKDQSREIYLYDTFEGMAQPSALDVDFRQTPAQDKWQELKKEDFNAWCYSSLEETKNNMLKTNYPLKGIRFIKGKVENTIPGTMPDKIALLRLDTDWFESTYHELRHLYPRIAKHGIIIIDDYGHWQGAQKAVDKYLTENGIKIFLHRIDYSARLGIKLD